MTIWGGALFTRAEVEAGQCEAGTIAAVDDDLYLASPAGAPETPDRYLNHSCDSNLWLRDEVTLVTRRVVAAGEELMLDYCLFEGSEDVAWRGQRARSGAEQSSDSEAPPQRRAASNMPSRIAALAP